MPEMRFRIRWPERRHRGLLLAVARHQGVISLRAKAMRSPISCSAAAVALNIASDRVEAKYGYACSRAMAQLARIETVAKSFSAAADARVTVEAFET